MQFNKDVSNGRWRAYAKGTIELCEKYSKFVIQGRSTLVEAPKDVRRLEALKPANTPSMGERYDASVAKEKRLEAATQPVMKAKPKSTPDASQGSKEKSGNKRKNEDVDEDSDSDGEDRRQKKSKPKSKKRVTVVNEADLKNVEALKEEDEVQEGVVWSDSDIDSD